jgi:hypothetical protein
VLSRNKPSTDVEDERLRAFVAQGVSIIKVAAALKRKIVSVRTRARVAGLPLSNASGNSKKVAGHARQLPPSLA